MKSRHTGNRILHIVPSLAPGGRTQLIHQLARHQSKLGQPVCVAVTHATDQQKNLQSVRVESLNYNGHLKNLPGLFRAIFLFGQLEREFRPSVIHVHSWSCLWIVVLHARWREIPVLVHIHEMQRWIRERSVKARILRLLTRGCVDPKATKYVSVSRIVEQFHQGWVIPQSAESAIALNPVDSRMRSDLVPPIREASKFVLGFAGRIAAQKQPLLLVKVLSSLLQKGMNAELVVAGEGELLPSLKERVLAQGLSERVRWLGWIEEMRGFYSSIDAVLLTSEQEGMPLVVLEAMACGVPVVALDVGGIREVLIHGETGFIAADEGELIQSILLLQDEKLRQRISLAARQRADSVPSTESWIASIESLYKRGVSKKPVEAFTVLDSLSDV